MCAADDFVDVESGCAAGHHQVRVFWVVELAISWRVSVLDYAVGGGVRVVCFFYSVLGRVWRWWEGYLEILCLRSCLYSWFKFGVGFVGDMMSALC